MTRLSKPGLSDGTFLCHKSVIDWSVRQALDYSAAVRLLAFVVAWRFNAPVTRSMA